MLNERNKRENRDNKAKKRKISDASSSGTDSEVGGWNNKRHISENKNLPITLVKEAPKKGIFHIQVKVKNL